MNQGIVQLSIEQAKKLNTKIKCLRIELEEIITRIEVFEANLRAGLTDLLIEEQELTILYKQQKQLKKEKRLEQKRKGKNYVAPTGLIPANKPKPVEESPNEKQERKRLYREAMMQVHPDRFSMHEEEKENEATEITTQLIEIYQSGDLMALREYHAYITKELNPTVTSHRNTISENTYLLKEIERLQQAISEKRNKYTYVVLTTYPNPSSFLDELKTYYQDRVSKLRKRTRS